MKYSSDLVDWSKSVCRAIILDAGFRDREPTPVKRVFKSKREKP